MNDAHIDVTIDCRNIGGGLMDLRIPKEQQVKVLIENILNTLKIRIKDEQYYLKISTKKVVVFADEYLTDAFVTTGDILEICK